MLAPTPARAASPTRAARATSAVASPASLATRWLAPSASRKTAPSAAALDAARERGGDVDEGEDGRALDGGVARADDEVGGDGARLGDGVTSGLDAALTRFRRGGDDGRVRPAADAQRERQAGEVGIGATRGRDGQIGNEKTGDARHRAVRRTPASRPACARAARRGFGRS
jgi:hypothetical protein